MSRKQLDNFLRLLKASPSGAVFNPWWQINNDNDVAPHSAAAIRRKHLTVYFRERLGKCAAGHNRRSARLSRWSFQQNADDFGAHAASANSRCILSDIEPRRTSKPSICADGFSEPTATIVWGALLKTGMLQDEFVLWNAFPWHSFDPIRGRLSNRMPNKSEQVSGRHVLKDFLELFACKRIVALGKIAGAQLEQLGVNARCVRHPASGGAKLFRQQIEEIVR